MTKITSGIAKGKNIYVPDIEGYRSVQEKAKLAIFSILHKKIGGAKCLDLYAGSGNIGLEALSRGASFCDFVDENTKATEVIEKNLRNLGFLENAEVFRSDVVKFVSNSFDKYDVVFLDPFYRDTSFKYLFENLEKLLNEGGVVVFSHGADTNVREGLSNTKGLEIYDEKRYGNAFVTILRLT